MTVIIRAGSADTDVINVLYENLFSEGTFTFSTQATDHNAANAIEDSTWNTWQPTAVPAFLSVDMGVASYCDTVGIAAHNMGTSGASFNVQHSADGIAWTTVSASYAPSGNDTILLRFALTLARYWRINVTGAICDIGVIKMGRALKFPCSPISGHVALHHSVKVDMLSSESLGGNFLGNRPVRKGAETNIDIGQVPREWAETDMAEFEEHYNNGGAFFYCGSPSTIPKDLGYCRRDGSMREMVVVWSEGDVLADVSFDVRSYIAG